MKIITLVALFSLLLTSCSSQAIPNKNNEYSQNTSRDTQFQENETIMVAGSIVPISSVVSTIGGEYIEVQNLVPAGVSPHGFDLSAKKMAELSKSEKVFMLGLEHIDGFLDDAVNKEKQVHLADGMELINLKDKHENEHHDDYHDHEKHSSDPHVWMGKENIITIATKIRDELSTIMPKKADTFAANTQAFIDDLEIEFNNFETQTAGKTASEFIVFHDAYNYLILSIGIDMNLKKTFSENILHDTGTAHLAELSGEIKEHGIKYAFSEPQFATGNLEKLANTHSLEIRILDPHGTSPGAGGYIENLRSNLENLAKVYE